MRPIPERFDLESVAAEWDAAADTYTEGQLSGGDVYRYAFFGPAHVALCGPVAGLTVLDLGCGSGYFSREMAARGATVTGIDISARLLEHARALEAAAPLGIVYRQLDAARAGEAFPPGSFDLVTACLSVQDMPDTAAVFHAAFAVLRPGGRFVLSTTHPVTDTPLREWEIVDGARRSLKIGEYYTRGPRSYTWNSPRWRAPITTSALHVTLGEWCDWFLAAGFQLRALREPCPDAGTVAAWPELADARLVPEFLLLDLERPS